MNREETIKVIQDYTEYFNKAKEQGREVNVFDYVDSLEMNKEKAIDILERWLDPDNFGKTVVGKTIQFAIDYMKSSQDEGEVIGWVNYYKTQCITKSVIHLTVQAARSCAISDNAIQIPIRKPKK
jgi:hypothetical protein